MTYKTRALPRDLNVYLQSGTKVKKRGIMQMFFVFNTSFCKSDEDDPKDAFVYFYPLDICDDWKHELCFQLVGISQFLRSTFASPVVVSLDQGKFAFCRSQDYLLVLGGRSVVDSTILKENLQFLYRVFAFCLKDINSVLMACHNNRVLFLQKMKEIWDHILLTSEFFGNMTHAASSIIPLTLPQQNASDIHSRTKRLLHMCQRNPPVIAGAVFCEKHLVYSQLIPEITRNLVFLLNPRDCDTSPNAQTAYELPPGVKMKKVYLTRKEISSILKHNHTNVGSHIRYQNYKKTPISQCGTTSLSSGSEGDVDSGNSSDGAEALKSDNSNFSCSNSHSHSKAEPSLVSTSAVSETPSPYHVSSFCSRKVSYKNIERCISTDTERSYSTAYESAPGNVFDRCRRHSQFVGPTSGSLWKYAVLQRRHSFSCVSNSRSTLTDTYCDNEFCLHTSLSRIFECTEKFDLSIPRKCNFEDLPHFNYRTMQNMHSLLAESCYLCLVKNQNLSTELFQTGVEKRLQVLKCRVNKRRNSNHAYTTQSSKCSMDGSFRRKRNSSSVGSIQDSSLANMYERHEMFLYIQRYCSCTLFLLLNNSFDEEVLSDLWMHGFSHLGEIELESRKCMLSTSNKKKHDFHIRVLDSVRHELSGRVPYVSPGASDAISDTALQIIHVDLQSNPSLRSVSLLSQSRSLVGYHVSQNEVYYIQPGTVNVGNEVSTHREPFTHLYKKARRRIKKYFGISVIDV